MSRLLLDADPTGGILLAGWTVLLVACTGVYVTRRPRLPLPRQRLVAALACAALFGAGATGLGLAFLPITAFPPYAFRFLCLPFWIALVAGLLAALPARWKLSLGTVVACILGLALAGTLLRLQSPLYEGGAYTRRHFLYDPQSGYRGRPGIRVRSRKRLAARVIYDVEYAHDAFGRRALAVPERSARSLLCFGCSFTYGEGVEGAETWPARIALARPHLAVYNYAFPGWGPAQMLDLARLRDLAAETAGPSRVVVYYFLDSHVTRVAGSWRFISGWGGSLSRYELSHGSLVRRGAFSLTQSVPEFLACQTLGGLGLLRSLGLDVPAAPDPTDLTLVAAVFGAARERLAAQLGDCPLTVVFPPGSRYAAHLSPQLEALGWRCLRLPDDLRIDVLPDDGHPMAAGHQALADSLLGELEGTR